MQLTRRSRTGKTAAGIERRVLSRFAHQRTVSATPYFFMLPMLAGLVQQIAIHVVNPPALPAAVTQCNRALKRRVIGTDLAHNVQAFTSAVDSLPDDFFRAAFALHFNGINERHAALNRYLDHGDLSLHSKSACSHTPGAGAESGDSLSVGKHSRQDDHGANW